MSIMKRSIIGFVILVLMITTTSTSSAVESKEIDTNFRIEKYSPSPLAIDLNSVDDYKVMSVNSTVAPSASLDLEEVREKMFATINEQRAYKGLKSLTYNNKLEFVSQRHAEYMTENYLNSNDGSNRNPGRRLEAEGIKWWAIGENIGIIYTDNNINHIFEENDWFFDYTNRDPYPNRLDPDFTNIGIGLAMNEERQELYFCVDYYTPYTNQEARKRPYAELIPEGMTGWEDEEKEILYASFSFRNTGNTNLTNIQIEINLTNLNDGEDIIATGIIDFQGVLTPGQVVTASYQTQPGAVDEETDYIHYYTINSFEITEKQNPEHYFSKIFTLSYDENNDVILDARLINTGDKTFSFFTVMPHILSQRVVASLLLLAKVKQFPNSQFCQIQEEIFVSAWEQWSTQNARMKSKGSKLLIGLLRNKEKKRFVIPIPSAIPMKIVKR
jgi:uncharacterized protein YkwD